MHLFEWQEALHVLHTIAGDASSTTHPFHLHMLDQTLQR